MMVIEDYEQVRRLWMTIQGFGIRSIDDTREEVDRFKKEILRRVLWRSAEKRSWERSSAEVMGDRAVCIMSA